jgi:nitrite reductase/ring-hydroxylating ferredoxin subunit
MAELFAICPTSALEDGQATGFVLMRKLPDGSATPWPIIITRKAGFFGFENICPHHGGPLDKVPGQFLDNSGNFLACGGDHSMFDPDSGKCFIGPAQGKALTPIALIIDDVDVCLTGVDLAEEDGLDRPEPDAMPEVMITSD